MTHPSPKRNMVPKAILMRSSLVSLTTARPVIDSSTTLKYTRVNIVSGKNVNTARPKAVLNVVKGNQVNAVKASACWVWEHVLLLTLKKLMENMLPLELTDESHVLLKVPRKNNMYSVDLKNIVPNGGTKRCDVHGNARLEQSSPDDGFKPSRDDEKKITKEPRKEGDDSSKEDKSNDQEKDDNVNNTNNVNAASTNEVNDVGGKSSIELPDDQDMPELEDIVYSDDNEDVGAEADMNNLDAFMLVSPIPTTRMDVKSAFLYGKIEEKVYICQHQDLKIQTSLIKYIRLKKHCMDYIKLLELDDIIFGSTKKSLCTEFEKMMHKKFQMSSVGELTFFLGLQVKHKEDWIFISQDKCVTEILKKFDFTNVKTASTPMETQKPLLKDEDVTKWMFIYID
ncbi:putative ribonuclease H-like domain-containing protein [Tanacetum coccineum]